MTTSLAQFTLTARARVKAFSFCGDLYRVVDEGDLTVIRPGIYCRERQLRDFSYAAGLPVINENCPACFEVCPAWTHYTP
jgi:tRNA(Ile)-lysidine synthase TilS/MesJ